MAMLSCYTFFRVTFLNESGNRAEAIPYERGAPFVWSSLELLCRHHYGLLSATLI